MSIIATFNGLNVIALPCDTVVGVTMPSSIEWDPQELVAVNRSPFTGQTQTYDWGAAWWEGHVSFPPMSRMGFDYWTAFLAECRGPVNAFSLGDPRARVPKGAPAGTPVVSGAGQTGFSLVTRGWRPSASRLLLPGDFIQIGYRMYKVMDQVNADSSGDATISLFPNLRDQPADGAAIQCENCKGLFTLKDATGNKYSTNVGNYGLTGFAIKEAI
jgi:hypothetical protein